MSLLRRLTLASLAVLGVTVANGNAFAGWNSVAQLTCDCRPRTSFFRQPDCDKPEVRRSYVQRTYYQPVTEWKAEKYLEPVKVNERSSYYEPVTSYSYSSYYDPCSGECQRIATPHTEYRLKTQCNTSYKYVERTRMVPVQTLKPVTMMQPVVTYYYPPRRASGTIGGERLIDPSEIQGLQNAPTAPQTEIERTGGSELIPNPGVPSKPPMNMPNGASRARTASFAKASALRGEVVANDRITPRGNTKVVLMNAADGTTRKDTITNEFGEFNINVPAGEWHIYLGTGTGKATFHSTVKIAEGQTRDVTVASR
ncbi:MAG: hypothetical protein U0798_19755 [Gemmataceae bacterium]